jgi:flavin-dependent dehydrogenase
MDYRRRVPIGEPVDVLVVGGGPAGIAAALAAARGGARTLLIERFGYLGGNLTAGLVGPCMTSFSLDGSEQLIRGVFDELVRRLVALGQARHPSEIPAGSAYCGFIEYGHDKVTPFEPEAVKLVAEQMCAEAGVELLLHTFVADVRTEGDAVTGVVCASKSGLRLQPATVVVDCSADGDVAAAAGAKAEVGRESDGLTQPMTLFFRIRSRSTCGPFRTTFGRSPRSSPRPPPPAAFRRPAAEWACTGRCGLGCGGSTPPVSSAGTAPTPAT